MVFDSNDINFVQDGRDDLCFGEGYRSSNRKQQLYPPGFQVLNRAISIDPNGGEYGRGVITGEADIDPNHWIFDAHFKNDPVLPAIFMIEGGVQLLSFYAHWSGIAHAAGAKSQRVPLINSTFNSKFRGEIKREPSRLSYECVIKDWGASSKTLCSGRYLCIQR